MPVKENVDIADHPARNRPYRPIIHQIPRGDQNLALTEKKLGQTVPDENAMKWRQKYFIMLAERVCGDPDGRIITRRDDIARSDPAQGLWTLVTRHDQIAGFQSLDRNIPARREDHCAGNETGNRIDGDI